MAGRTREQRAERKVRMVDLGDQKKWRIESKCPPATGRKQGEPTIMNERTNE